VDATTLGRFGTVDVCVLNTFDGGLYTPSCGAARDEVEFFLNDQIGGLNGGFETVADPWITRPVETVRVMALDLAEKRSGATDHGRLANLSTVAMRNEGSRL